MEQYHQGSDGLRQEWVGSWVSYKHELLQGYVRAARSARMRLRGEPCLIDLYCGPGRARIRGTTHVVQGGTLAAVAASLDGGPQASPFRRVFIGDMDPENTAACKTRLQAAYSLPVEEHVGPAEVVVSQIVARLPPKGLHLAYLDPYSLNALPFSVLEMLSRAGRVDLMIHFASLDMVRNLINRPDLWLTFDRVAPGWRDACAGMHGKSELRKRFFEHWESLLVGLGYHVSPDVKSVRNKGRREIYRLLLASKHPLGANIWSTLRGGEVQTGFKF